MLKIKIYITGIRNLISNNIILRVGLLDKMEELKMFLFFVVTSLKVGKVHSLNNRKRN